MPRPNKRPRLEQSTEITSKAEKSPLKKGQEKEKDEGDAQLDEFMQVMQSRAKKGPSWKDAEVPAATASSSSSPTKPEAAAPEDDKGSASDAPRVDEPASDMDWLKRHVKSSLDISESADKQFVQSDDEMEGSAEASKSTPRDEARNTILLTGRLFLRNLAFACTEDELLELFKPFGEVSQVSYSFHAVRRFSHVFGMTNLDRDIRVSTMLIPIK